MGRIDTNKSTLVSSVIFKRVKGSWDQKFWEWLPPGCGEAILSTLQASHQVLVRLSRKNKEKRISFILSRNRSPCLPLNSWYHLYLLDYFSWSMSSAGCVFLDLYWRNKFYICSFFSIASCFFSDLCFINTSFLLSVDTFCYFSNFLKWSFYLLILAFLSLFYICFKAVTFPVSSILAVCLRFGHVIILLLLWSHYFLISLWCCLIHFLLRIMEKMFCLGGLQSYLLLMISNLIAKWVESLVCWFPIFNIRWSMHSESEHGPFFVVLWQLGEKE